MRKKLFTLLSLLALIGVWAWAEEAGTSEETKTYVAKVGDSQYETLQGAIDAATEDNQTVSLLSDVTLRETVTINKNLTLDLVNYKIEAVDVRAFHIIAGNVTFKRSGTKQGYIIANPAPENSTFDESSSVIRVGDNNGEQRNVSLTIEKGVHVKSNYCYGITVFGNKTKETVTINGKVTTWGNESAISGNGSSGYGDTNITINGSVTSYNTYAIYQPQNGNLIINGTVGDGTTTKPLAAGIEAKSGNITINDGACVFSGKNPTVSHNPYTNGPSTTGYAIAVVENNKYAGATNVTIDFSNSGKISGEIAILEDSGYGVESSKKASITIKNGKFSKKPNESYIESGKKVAAAKNVWYVCDENRIVAKNGDYEYPFFNDAFNDLGKQDTLQLLADVSTTSQLKVTSAKAGSIIDLNGHKLSYAGTSTIQGGLIFVYHSSSLTIKDSSSGKTGDINPGEKAHCAIQIGSSKSSSTPAVLTIESGNITGHYYAISGNGTYHNTEITINGGVLKATKNEGNLGIYHPQDGKLTIKGGQIEGYNSAIELRAGTLNISGGSFKSTASKYTVDANGSGSTTSGAAIAIAQHTTLKDINVSISGGTFTGHNGICVVNPQKNTTNNVKVAISNATVNATDKAIISEHGTTSITGGSFSSDPNKFCAEGYYATKSEASTNYAVEKIKSVVIPTPSLTASNVTIDTAGSSGGGAAPNLDEAKSAVNDVVTKNSSVSNFDTTPASESLSMTEAASTETSETVNIGDETVGVRGKTIIELVKKAAEKQGVSEESKKNIVASDINQIVKIKFNNASVKKEGDNVIVERISFNIKPTAVVMVDDKRVELPVPNALIANPITFRLPVDNNTKKQFVELYHKEDNSDKEDQLGLFEIRTDNGNKYVEVSATNFSEYGYELSEISGNIDVYLGTATKETKAVGDWESILENTPNAIAIVNSQLVSWAEKNRNVIVEYGVGSSSAKYYECTNFVLTDLEDFYTPVEFKALGGSYNRQPNAATNANIQYNSVCLPFAFDATDLSGTAKILTFAYYDNENTAYFNHINSISAGIPCIIQEKGNSWKGINLTGKTIVASPNMDGNMRGTFVTTNEYGKNGTDKTDYYSVDNDNMFSPLNTTLSPFRSCLWLHNDGSIGQGSASAKAIRIIEDGETTGIESVDSSDIESQEIYTINGMKVSGNAKSLPRGMYIMNGKKFIIR